MALYESSEKIKPGHLDLERARLSLKEELEATNWYQERIDATADETLKKILQHNMDEEKEHIAMLMGWLEKNDPKQKEAFEKHD